MKLLEYEAKRLLKSSSIPVPRSEVFRQGDSATFALPFVAKSQVPVGGRGKAGGIVVVDSDPDSILNNLFTHSIHGFLPSTLLLEEKLSIAKEFYLSIMVDRSTQGIVLLANKNGGVEVEENSSDSFLRIELPAAPDFDAIGQQLADEFDCAGQTFALQDLAERLYECLVKTDALLIEINPLVVTTESKLVAGDCKMTLDDAAGFRHEWEFEEKPAEANFVTLDPNGNIATIANGAGLAMATVDAAHAAGLTPANFLDIGGGANTETLLAAFKRLVEYPDLKAIIINIFAGITRCDEVARAIIAAKEQIDTLPPLFIRLAGTGYEDALPILEAAQVTLLPSLEECLAAAKREIIS